MKHEENEKSQNTKRFISHQTLADFNAKVHDRGVHNLPGGEDSRDDVIEWIEDDALTISITYHRQQQERTPQNRINLRTGEHQAFGSLPAGQIENTRKKSIVIHELIELVERYFRWEEKHLKSTADMARMFLPAGIKTEPALASSPFHYANYAVKVDV